MYKLILELDAKVGPCSTKKILLLINTETLVLLPLS
jgi:hypothetical protein